MVIRRMKARFLLAILGMSLLMVIPSSPGLAGEGIPDEKRGVSPFEWFLTFYRDNVSAVDGDRCPSVPSCSSYAVQAFRKHGVFMGWMMTVDRLIHEGAEETVVSPIVYSDGKWKIFDPVRNNDFWWHPEAGRRHD